MTAQLPSNRPGLDEPGAASKPLRDASAKPVQRRLLIPLAAVLLLLVGGSGAVLLCMQRDNLERSSREKLAEASYNLEERLEEQTRTLSALEDGLLANAGLTDALKAQDRDRLLVDYEPILTQFRAEHGITHLYFHRPDRVNLLRVHKPEKNGDLIDRFTAREAERTGKTASGIELGQLGTFTLRVVRPVLDGDALVGYLELGKEIEDILAGIHDRRGVELAVSIHKNALKREKWEAGMKMLGREGDWDRFPNEVLIYVSLPHFPVKAERFVGEAGHTHGDLAAGTAFGGKTWRVLVAPLTDVSGAEVGDLLIFHDTSEAVAHFNRLLAVASGAALVLLAVLIGLLYNALRRVDRGVLAREADLARSERFQRTLTETSPDFIFVLDRDMTIRMVNRLLPGHRVEDVVGHSVLSLISPEYQDSMREAFGQALETRELRSVETSVRLPDGEHFFLNRLNPLPDADEEQAVLLISTDITERKRAENAVAARAVELEQRTVELEKSRRVAMGMMEDAETARNVAEAAREGLRGAKDYTDNIIRSMIDMLVVVAPDGTIRTVNEATCSVLGYPEEELIAQPASLLFSEEEEEEEEEEEDTAQLIVSQEALPFKRTVLRRLVKDGAISSIERTFCAKSGHTIPVLMSGSVMRDNDGTIRGIVCVAQDITERKRAEEAVRESEERHRAITETAQDAIITANAEGIICLWNSAAEKVFGFTASEAIGKNMMDLIVPPQYHEAKRRGLAEFARTGRGLAVDNTLELTASRKDGTEFPIEISVSGYRDQEGFVAVALVRDITERALLQSQLTQAQKLESIGQLAAGIAHEINTPTQFIGDNIRFLHDAFADLRALLAKYAQLHEVSRSDSPSSDLLAEVDAAVADADVEYLMEEVPKAIDQSLEGVGRVATIVRSMKEFSHPGGADKQPADLNRAIESTITVARNEWKYVAEMVTDFDSSLPLVPCLVGDFNQVILNMIINAAHAIRDMVGDNTGEKGTITLTTRRDGDWAEIRISDTGTGMTEEVRAKIFDPFFTTKTVGKGTGQGLAIAHTVVVKKHGGRIDMQSEVGRGTTFIIRLPIEPEPAEEPATECHEEAHSIR
ncbi:MAG: PAS domain S-box protein [Phycisphaerae bacterium]